MMIHKMRVVICLLCALLTPSMALSGDVDDRLEALEARIEALEARLAAFDEPEPDADTADTAETVRVDGEMRLSETLTVRINRFETGLRFRYYPSGGATPSTLSAKTGYALLALFVTVENKAHESVATDDLLHAELLYGSDGVSAARDSFYHLTSRGIYAGDLTHIPAESVIEGCILFALPEEVAAKPSSKQVLLRMAYANTLFEHMLLEGRSLLPPKTDATGF